MGDSYKPIDKDILIDLYEIKEYTIKKIGKILGIGQTTVRKRMIEHGIKIRKKTDGIYNKINQQRVIRLYTEKELSLDIISVKIGVSRPLIKRVLEENNIEIRTHTDARNLRSKREKENKNIEKPLRKESLKGDTLEEKILDARINKNLLIQDISEQLEIPTTEVYTYLIKNNIL